MTQTPDLRAQRPWLAHYPAGVPAELALDPQETLVSLWRGSRARYAKCLALESFGAKLNYEQLGAAADRVTAWLQAQGLAKGDRVAIMAPNVMAYPAIALGVLQAGCVLVNVNPLYTARELEFQLTDATPRILFVLENFKATVQAVQDRLALEKIVLVAPGDLLGLKGFLVNFVSRRIKKSVPAIDLANSLSFAEIFSAAKTMTPREVAIGPEDLAVLQYTGGTTGSAKGAMLRHKNLAANIEQCVLWFGAQLRDAEESVMVAALPLYHIFAFTACFWFQMRTGGACLLIANPRDIAGFIKSLRKYRFHLFAGVNTLFNALADHPDIKNVDFSHLRLSIAGGMTTQASVAKKWKKLTGGTLIEGYGLSEASPVLCANPTDLEEFSGTVGFPVPSTEISIRDAAGHEVAQGASGEIYARGPQIMAGYWDRPMATEAAMTADGFLRTGDAGVFLPDGQVKIVDRLKDMIIVSGFNVYPNEVEEVLVAHDKVREAAVIGRPSTATGEEVVAFVVPRDDSLTVEELRAFCRERLTGYKMPREFLFRDDLPKSNVGKVLRRSLKDLLNA